MTEEDLLELQKEIDEAKQREAELKGEKKALMNQLKEDWGCTTIKQAHKKLSKLEQKKDELKSEIDDALETLEEKYFE